MGGGKRGQQCKRTLAAALYHLGTATPRLQNNAKMFSIWTARILKILSRSVKQEPSLFEGFEVNAALTVGGRATLPLVNSRIYSNQQRSASYQFLRQHWGDFGV
jgi:hypothetical protein